MQDVMAFVICNLVFGSLIYSYSIRMETNEYCIRLETNDLNFCITCKLSIYHSPLKL